MNSTILLHSFLSWFSCKRSSCHSKSDVNVSVIMKPLVTTWISRWWKCHKYCIYWFANQSIRQIQRLTCERHLPNWLQFLRRGTWISALNSVAILPIVVERFYPMCESYGGARGVVRWPLKTLLHFVSWWNISQDNQTLFFLTGHKSLQYCPHNVLKSFIPRPVTTCLVGDKIV